MKRKKTAKEKPNEKLKKYICRYKNKHSTY